MSKSSLKSDSALRKTENSEDDSQSPLIWSPVFKILEQRLTIGDSLILLIVPFVKLDALKQLLWTTSQCKRLKVLVRWKPEDILCGASDLEIYPFLRDQGMPLYFNQRIHLKLYIFDSNVAFNTSGNLTLKGLGYSERGNVEVGNMVTLAPLDWRNIYALLNESTQVDDDVFETISEIISGQKHSAIPPAIWPKFPRKEFTIQNLPASETPESLVKFYISGPTENGSDIERRCQQDLVTFEIGVGLTADQMRAQLFENVRRNVFIAAFVTALRERGQMHFGGVSSWIHDKCEDVPVPYRYEVKDAVRILYNWVSAAYDEVTWDRPNHSQIIFWKKTGAPSGV